MRFFLIPVLLLLLLFPASAENLLQEEDSGPAFSASWTASDVRSDAVSLTLSLSNLTENPMDLKLIVPSWNHVPALFDGRQYLVSFSLQPGEIREAVVTVLPDGRADAPENISFRFCVDGRISGPVSLSLPDGKCGPAVFAGAEADIIAEEVRFREGPEPAPLVLSDTVPAGTAACLEKAYAQICLKREDGLLRRIVTLPVQVDDEGNAEAVWSGLALAFEEEESFPVPSLETHDGSVTVWSADYLSFYGEDIYFASMAAAVTRDTDGIRVSSRTAEAEEFGTAVFVPYDLFSEGSLSAPLTRIVDHEGALVPETRDADTCDLVISSPLHLMLVPAPDPAELVCYFEYFLTDGTDFTHLADSVL